MRTIVPYAWTWNDEPWFSSFNIATLKGIVKRFPSEKQNLSSLRRSWQKSKYLNLFYVSVLRLGNAFKCLLKFALMWTVGRCSTSSASPEELTKVSLRNKPVKWHKLSLSPFKGAGRLWNTLTGSAAAHTSSQQLPKQVLQSPCDQREWGEEADNKWLFPGSLHVFLEWMEWMLMSFFRYQRRQYVYRFILKDKWKWCLEKRRGNLQQICLFLLDSEEPDLL